MESTFERKVTRILVLDDFEAQWLKSVMQNLLSHNEEEIDKQMRARFFNALDKPEEPF